MICDFFKICLLIAGIITMGTICSCLAVNTIDAHRLNEYKLKYMAQQHTNEKTDCDFYDSIDWE